MTKTFRLAAGIAAIALVMASCTQSSDGSSGGSGGSTEDKAAQLTDSAPGVTAETIKIGILVVDVDALAAVGVKLSPGNREAQWQAAIDTANDAGGINGRMIEPVFQMISPVGNTASDAACVKFTEDDPVFLVTGVLIRDQPLCYSGRHDTSVITLQPTIAEVVSGSKAPLRSYRAVAADQTQRFVTAALAAGALKEGDKIGVIEANNDDATFDGAVKALRDKGLDVVEGPISTPDGDEVALRSAQGAVLERFKSDGVDVVVNAGLGLFPLAVAEQGGYDFPFVLSQFVEPSRFAAENISATASDGVFALADSLVSTAGQPELAEEPAVAACLEAYEATDGSEKVVTDPSSEVTNLNGAIESCNVIDVFVKAATAAGPDLTNKTFSAGLDGLGQLDLAGLPYASLAPGKVSISDTAVPVRFDAEKAQWVPTGDAVDAAAA